MFDFEESGFSISIDGVPTQWGFNDVFSGIVITDITPDPLATISGFTLTNEMYDLYGNLVDFTEDMITYTNDSIWLNFEGLTMLDGVITIDLEFTPVPIPAAIWLFASGFTVLSGFARKRK